MGDRGVIRVPGGLVQVEDTQRPVGELIVHRGRVAQGEIQVDARAELEVDAAARAATVRNHSGTHLLHAALRQVLGPQAMQKGSLVAPGRLRFDFTHDAPLETAQLDAIEDFANEWIEANVPANVREMSYPDAIAAGAIAIFEEKYGERVRVISFGEFSTELCGGTHARATGDIGLLKIVSESGIASGVRRIEALTGLGALALLREQERTLERVAAALRTSVAELPERVEKLCSRGARRSARSRSCAPRSAAPRRPTSAREARADRRRTTLIVSARIDGVEAPELRPMVDQLREQLGSGVVLLASEQDAPRRRSRSASRPRSRRTLPGGRPGPRGVERRRRQGRRAARLRPGAAAAIPRSATRRSTGFERLVAAEARDAGVSGVLRASPFGPRRRRDPRGARRRRRRRRRATRSACSR